MSIPVGTKVKFIGYAELQPGDPEILTADTLVIITGYSAEEDKYSVEVDGDESIVDTVFSDEIEELPVEEAPVEAKPARTRAKPAAKAEAAPAPAPAAKAPVKAAKAPAKAEAKPAAKPAAVPADAGTAGPAAMAKSAKAPKAEAEAKKSPALVILSSIRDYVGEAEHAVQSAKDLAARLGTLSEQEEETKFALGGTLAFIKANGIFRDRGHETIEAFCEAEVGLKSRSCQYYIATYEALTQAGITEKEIEGIGHSKLRALTGVIDAGNKSALLKKAKAMTRDDFVDHVKELKQSKGKVSPTDPNAATFMKFKAFKMFEDQGQLLDRAVNDAKARFSVESFAEALFHIAAEWMQAQEVDVSLDVALETLNARYGTDFSLEGEDEGTEVDTAAAA